MLIYIIVGSIREGRTAIKVANWVYNQLVNHQDNAIQVELVDLKQWNLPLFSGSHPPATGIYDQPKQQEWANKIAQAEGFIFISPEYNHGYSPALKNALDYLGKEWKNKPVAFVGYGSTYGSRSISQIRQVTSSLDMIDPNAVIEIRDIFKRNQSEEFEANDFEIKSLINLVEKLKKYHKNLV
ncbi:MULTISPECIES: NADPH-dependent FMN reductase [unclassified Acinetobacter]|uniref:NADPH-dependent FMN reductase n=1 Tax=unclassified Acinetobacter TaxID=196816 RepID=UPI0019094E50|nr:MULTISPECIES: NAD(P)H-dependent oxidoreductase [unclassified Acinetobacter]MBK0064324.1 NAD(P)H-dependent oxidoreductase [Acinetobacter sp. S55]MBK0067684.1 NAD(P)H-dependent oxidoreductase [Acinetobacter sp. S54]